jgi:hypothetical protein
MPLPVEHLVAALDLSQLGELAGRDSTHGVEVLEGGEIAGLQFAEVHAGGHESRFDVVPGEAVCVLPAEAHHRLWVLAMVARRSATTWG